MLGGKEHKFTFDFSYNSFVPRDDPDYASQTTVWEDLGVGVLQNAFDGKSRTGVRLHLFAMISNIITVSFRFVVV